jgi:uncharacterized protein
MMKNTALITGASSGIGRELARIHAGTGGNLVLVARNREALEKLSSELTTEYKVACLVVSADLSREEECTALYDSLEKKGIEIDYLINNAGFGGRGNFSELPLRQHLDMIDVNIRALTHLSRLFLPGMLSRGKGKVLNIASSAAFLPGPRQAVYYASKSFVLSLSLAMSEELRPHGISVTASCPGPVATEFFVRADMNGSRLAKNAQSAKVVAVKAYKAMIKGKRISYSSPWLRMLPLVMPLWNTRLMLRISRKAMEL